jgi:hypothetical protein
MALDGAERNEMAQGLDARRFYQVRRECRGVAGKGVLR